MKKDRTIVEEHKANFDKVYVKQFPDKSLRTNIENLAGFCEQVASMDPVRHRREAFEKVAISLRKIAAGRYVARLLNYLE